MRAVLLLLGLMVSALLLNGCHAPGNRAFPALRGALAVDPAAYRPAAGAWQLPLEGMVWITWADAPSAASAVTFLRCYRHDAGRCGTPEVIGVDDDLSDGASLLYWTPRVRDRGLIVASGGGVASWPLNTVTDEAASLPARSLAFAPVVGHSHGMYGVQGGGELALTLSDVPPGAARVAFYAGLRNVEYTTGDLILIGAVESPGRTASVVWPAVPPERALFLFAVVYRADGSLLNTPFNAYEVYSGILSAGYGAVELLPARPPAADGFYRIAPGEAVTLGWPLAPPDAARVDFVIDLSDGTEFTRLTDGDLSDGAVVTWIVPANAGMWGSLRASATLPDGGRVQTEAAPQYVIESE